MSIKDCVIIGGGIAGLSAAIRLTELGIKPLILENGSYPSHKVCGEFLSPECLPQLHKWNISTMPIDHLEWHTNHETLLFPFPHPAGSLSHQKLDPHLANRAQEGGALIRPCTRVIRFNPKKTFKEKHIIDLENGESIQAHHAIIATGRIPGYHQKEPHFPYLGIKTHFNEIPIDKKLEMLSFKGGYLGVSPIEDRMTNVACLVKWEVVHHYGGPEYLINHLLMNHPLLGSYFSGRDPLFPWMIVKIPEFGVKQTPNWLDTYFIGDAAATIPPATGGGLSMSILSGCLAAEHIVESRFQEFQIGWKRRCSLPIKWGKVLNKIFLNPNLSRAGIKIAKAFPNMAQGIFNKTRQGRG